MNIVGGFYREQCCMPAWDAVFGSGGRSAAAICKLSPGSIFHTYSDDFNSDGITLLKKLGIKINLYPRPTPIVFSYFHPLSRPFIQPPLTEIEPLPQIHVDGDAVLRFGFLEGDAIVEARRAVYDPQTLSNPASFGANGSLANELAIVLNELELRSATGIEAIDLAAWNIIEHQNAAVVVVKRGIRGAAVYERGGKAVHIPTYRSSRIFKIGTGDIFSAVFAYYWAEKQLPAIDAADIASRSVAAYCSSVKLPLEIDGLANFAPIQCKSSGSVLIEGEVDTIGRRYTMEEAQFVLKDLGIDVFCPALGCQITLAANAVLILADGLDNLAAERILNKIVGKPIVVLRESRIQSSDIFSSRSDIVVVDDFSSALYFIAWAATESEY